MSQATRRLALAGLTAVVLLVLAILLTRGSSPAAAALPTVPPEIVQYANDWPVPQGNLAATRSAANSAISAANVAHLGVAWTFDLPATGAWGSITANPIVVGDTVYIQDMQSNVFALDRATGALKWTARFNVDSVGPNGVAVGYGKVYAALGDTSEVVALDSASGKEVWRRQIGTVPREGIDMAPIAYGGLVYVSSAPGTSTGFYRSGDRGVLYALDAADGAEVWSFATMKAADGGGLWYPPSFDGAGNMYFGVGNPAPYPLTPGCSNGSCRPGDNEYSDSMVSLDSKTGALRWYYQDRKHDLLGLDFQLTPILTTVNGKSVAIGAGKTGNVVAVNSGAVLWKTPIGKHQFDDVTALPSDVALTVFPGPFGGIESPIAYANGTVFAPYLDLPQYLSATSVNPPAAISDATGGLVAINAADGSVKWEAKIPTLVVGGATVANDVVFTSGLDGFMRAFNAGTGAELWSHEAQAGFNAPPAIAGDMVFVGAGFVKLPPPGGAPAATPDGQAPRVSRLIAFKLGAR